MLYYLFLFAGIFGIIDGLIKLNSPSAKKYRESNNLFDAIFR